MSLLAEDIWFGHGGRDVLRGVDLEVCPGEMVALVGPNGAGKTSLLRCLLAVYRPRRGMVSLDGRPLAAMEAMERARQLAYVPQASPARFPLTVFDTVLMGRRPHLVWRPSPADLEAVSEVLRLMNLSALAGRDFDRLSGGQRQKVLLARAFAQQARYMLLDEPTSSLDLKHQLEVLDLTRESVKTRRTGAVVAIHDLNLAMRFADRAVLLRQGAVFASGSPRAVLTPPNIRAVYEVEVEHVNKNGTWCLIPTGTTAEAMHEACTSESRDNLCKVEKKSC